MLKKGEIVIVRYLFLILGVISLIIGLIGLILPLLPTTPFVLLSASLFAKSSKRFHTWLLTNRLTGPIIFNWENNKTIPRRAKISAITMIFFSFFISVSLVSNLYFKLALVILAIALILYISRIHSTEKHSSFDTKGIAGN